MEVPVIFLAFANDKVDNARYLRNLPQELDGIRKALLPAIQANLCELVERANVTIENILDIFQDDRYRDRIAIFHYGGHADGYQLLLEQLDGSHAVAQGGGLVSFFARQKGLKLVFFNGCSTHQQSIELMQAGIPAVVGTSNAISDDVATDLSIRFYKGMAQGMTLDRSWNSAVDEIKIKKGEGNTRGLYRKEAAKQMVDERFPWDLLIREGAEIVKEFNLPSEVNNPLFGLPEIPKTYNLPEVPYQFLSRYERSHAEVFVGRADYIRDLYNRVTDKNSTPIIAIYGQAGVGKSSIFDAGLRPRLENSHTVVYISRIKDKGLLGTLEEVLGIKREQEVIEAEKESLLSASQTEIFEQKPVDAPLDFASFVDSAFKVDTPAEPQTFEGQAIEITNTSNNTTSQELLIIELRKLAEKADLVLQGAILSFIGQLTTADKDVNETTSSSTQDSILLHTWKEIERKGGKPLVIMLDHLEECYTRPMINLGEESEEIARVNMGEMEVEIFLQAIKKIFNDPNNLPKGKLLLGYRKEYHPDFEEWFKWYKLPQNKLFIDNLSRDEIIEVIQGITVSEKLRRNYQVSIETGLAEIIADDLLEDQNSAVTPVLQMTLMKLWKSCEHEGARLFTIQKYQEFKKAGLLMEDFINDQLTKIREWNQKAEESGLVLDILMQHTTASGTAGIQDKEKLKKLYAHKSKTLGDIVEKAKELYLLTDLGSSTGLTHDTLAPIIREKYRKSMYPAQRALRLLENKIVNFVPNDKNSSILDDRELGIVEDGGKGMRFWTETELEFIKVSQRRREINKQKRLWRRIAYVASVISVISFTIYSWYLKGKASQAQTRAEASQLMTLAVQNDDMTMALRLAARADSLATQVGDSSMREKLIEILATGSFYGKHWKEKLSDNTKICTNKESNKILFLDRYNDLVLKNMAGEELLRMNNQDISHFDLSPDGRKILTLGNTDNTVRIWDMGGKQLLFFQEQIADDMVMEAGFLPNGAGFYTNTNLTTIKFFDLKGSKFYEHNTEVNDIKYLALSPNAETMLLVVAILGDNEDYTYELQSWNTKSDVQNYVQNHVANIYQPCFSPDGTLFAFVSDDGYSYLHNNQGDTLAWWADKESKVSKIEFSADSKMLFTAHKNNIIKQYKTDLIIKNFNIDGNDDYIVPVRAFEESNPIDFMLPTPDGNWLLTANNQKGIKFWDLKNHYKILYGEVNDYIAPIAFAADGKEFFTTTQGGVTLSNWQVDEKGAFERKEINLSDTIDTSSLSFNNHAILRTSDSIRVLDFDLRTLVTLPRPNTDVNVFSKLSPDGQHVINFWADTIEVWNRKKERIAFIKERATNAFLTPNNQYAVTIDSYDESNFHAKLWDLKGKLLQTLKGHTAPITDVNFSADSRYIATSSYDQTAKVWDMNGKEITTLSGHYQAVNTVVFSPQNNYILTGSDDHTARLWNLSGKELNMYVAHKVYSAVFSPDGTKILTSGLHDFDQKDFFNISKSNQGGNQADDDRNAKDKYFITSVILWDISQDCAKWLNSDKIANFTLTDYLYAGASISVKTLLSLEDTEENAEQLNDAGFYYMSTDIPISGVPQGKRLGYAKDLFEKSLKIQRSYLGIAGLVEVDWRRKGKYDVGEMLKTKDIDELAWYMNYIYDDKLSVAKNKSDSSIYWRGLKKIAIRSLQITQTPEALSTLQKANHVLGDAKDDDTKMAFNSSLNEMRKYADFFKEEGTFKKVSLTQSAQVYEHILKSLKPTSQDFKGAAQVYNALAWEQLLDKEVIEAEKSINRGIELDKNHRPLFINQILVYMLSSRYDSAKKLYLREVKNGKIATDKSLKESLKEDIIKLEKAGLKIDETKASWLK